MAVIVALPATAVPMLLRVTADRTAAMAVRIVPRVAAEVTVEEADTPPAAGILVVAAADMAVAAITKHEL